MTDLPAERDAFLSKVQEAMLAHSQNSRKWDPLYRWAAERFVEDNETLRFVGKLLTEDKQLSNRLKKELPELRPHHAVLCMLDDVDQDAVERLLHEANLPEIKSVLILRKTSPVQLQIFEADQVSDWLLDLFPEIPQKLVEKPMGAAAKAAAAEGPIRGDPSVSIVIDDRVRRMIRIAISSSTGVILVGPPGTGKTRLLDEAVTALRAAPADYGFEEEIQGPLWATPEESWGTRDLVGGETVDEDGHLRFRPGKLLQAIQENRWLILDEANRADMDRIFGGMLTWLSGQEVELGRVSTDLESPVVILGWRDDPSSLVDGAEALDAEKPAGMPTVQYLAGREWRVLGTYNALDAQRVFRFGEALGRRFARVPIPPATESQFAFALAPLVTGLPAAATAAIEGLYGAHYSSAATALGPALFLRMAHYIRRGLESAGKIESLTADFDAVVEALPDVAELEFVPLGAGMDPMGSGEGVDTTASDAEATAPEALGGEPSPEAGTEPDVLLAQLVAEAYLVNAGPWLARYEPGELGSLKARSGAAISPKQWEWLSDLLQSFGYSA